jgi:hypothetical protein
MYGNRQCSQAVGLGRQNEPFRLGTNALHSTQVVAFGTRFSMALGVVAIGIEDAAIA